MSSNVPSKAQLFYDTGKGYSEPQSDTATVDSTSLQDFQKFDFDLPHGNVFKLRFDPLTVGGTVIVQNVAIRSQYGVFLPISAVDLVPLNQILRREQRGSSVLFATTPAADDPSITLQLHSPFEYKRSRAIQRKQCILSGNFILLAVVAIAFLTRRRCWEVASRLLGIIRRIDRVFESLAGRLSHPHLLVFDSYSLWFYAACVFAFLLASFADLNGSSTGMYSLMFGHHPRTLVGYPQNVRADEWSSSTPMMMYQSLRWDRFAMEQSSIGDHAVTLLANIPVRHVSTLFRPQFWGFFVLPVDYGYAVYWQCKFLILVTGLFTWLLLLTRSSFWALTGALWYFFSSFTQWTYSWQSLLPEMIGLICFTMVFACYLAIAKNRVVLAVAALGTAGCAINFALCAYVPHLIPLCWLCIFFLCFWCFAHRALLFSRDKVGLRLLAAPRLLAAGAACALIAAVGLDVYFDTRGAIAAIANTRYPGKRIFSGGSLTVTALTSHFIDWTETEQHFPPSLANVCEASGFLWLAPITLFLPQRLRALSKRQKYFLASLWGAFLFVLAWVLLPIPAKVGALFGMDWTAWTRCLPALGLANIAIVCLSLSGRPSDREQEQTSWLGVALQACGVFVPLFVILYLTNQALGSCFSWREVLLGTCLTELAVMLMLRGRRLVFALALVIPQAIAFGLVNPVQHGLPSLTSTALYRFIRTHPDLCMHNWVFFTAGAMSPSLLDAAGCDSYAGLRYLPDVDHFALFASHGLNPAAFNSAGILLVEPLEPNRKSYVDAAQPAVVRWYVSPLDPIFQQLGRQYFAFDVRPSPAIESRLIAITDKSLDGVWLYRAR